MKAKILDGKACATKVKRRVKEEVSTLKSEEGILPHLVTILVGDDLSSKIYLKKKHESCSEVGIESKNIQLPKDSTQDQVIEALDELNRDKEINGILVQLPLPKQISPEKVIETISPTKDVDGLTPYNVWQASYKKDTLLPCTPKGIVNLLQYNGISIAGENAVILGRSNLVGKPLQLLLTNLDATVTLCHSRTKNLTEQTRRADILVAAVGSRPDFIVAADMIKEGAVVVDVGMNMIEGTLCGDVDFAAAAEKASYITPVPGGVGPMTVATLLENVLKATVLQTKRT